MCGCCIKFTKYVSCASITGENCVILYYKRKSNLILNFKMWSLSNMHCKLKVNCTTPIPQLKLKSKNITFGISKVYQNLKVILVKN